MMIHQTAYSLANWAIANISAPEKKLTGIGQTGWMEVVRKFEFRLLCWLKLTITKTYMYTIP